MRWGRGWTQCHAHFVWEVLTAPRPRASRLRLGLVWQYVNSFSASWAVLMPTLLFLWATGRATFLPLAVTLALLFVTIPSRFLAYLVPGILDPVAPVPPRLRRRLRLIVDAYLWVAFGWMLQLRCLYLELSEAPRIWYGTRKQPVASGPPGVGSPAVSRPGRPSAG